MEGRRARKGNPTVCGRHDPAPLSQTICYSLEQFKKWAVPYMNKGNKDSLEFYITVLFYEPALPHPTILQQSFSFFLSLVELDTLLLCEMLRYFQTFQASQLCSRSWARKASHILAGRLPQGLQEAAGQKCQVILKISSLLNIAGNHAVIPQIFFFSNHSLLEALTFRILNSRKAAKICFCVLSQ